MPSRVPARPPPPVERKTSEPGQSCREADVRFDGEEAGDCEREAEEEEGDGEAVGVCPVEGEDGCEEGYCEEREDVGFQGGGGGGVVAHRSRDARVLERGDVVKGDVCVDQDRERKEGGRYCGRGDARIRGGDRTRTCAPPLKCAFGGGKRGGRWGQSGDVGPLTPLPPPPPRVPDEREKGAFIMDKTRERLVGVIGSRRRSTSASAPRTTENLPTLLLTSYLASMLVTSARRHHASEPQPHTRGERSGGCRTDAFGDVRRPLSSWRRRMAWRERGWRCRWPSGGRDSGRRRRPASRFFFFIWAVARKNSVQNGRGNDRAKEPLATSTKGSLRAASKESRTMDSQSRHNAFICGVVHWERQGDISGAMETTKRTLLGLRGDGGCSILLEKMSRWIPTLMQKKHL
ncbi:hypothetical protein BDK51DRAFT_34781 [Blyttiomyces helicus]|uniref:Uncharacterized protein n=1 Tax=Blyttiomyces helicus TaxID=388810 RepID=A0A4P9WFW8_9FUNG|nr:hypothetical protein BDK51DRAFT_34781 [Blyttiomyces helicus]|eukprot:RKO91232.1 hypothetical protein BDK51DRAFT_34781 [Blyttiomyces helicus]